MADSLKHQRGRSYNDELYDWDPMSADYNDPEFNSYSRGPGRKLDSQMQPVERTLFNNEGFRLYVRNIPHNASEKTMFNVFSRVGNVHSLKLGKPKGEYNIGFVTYNSIREAERAIREINGAPPFKLHVEFSEDEAGKQLRYKKKAALEENYFPRQLPPHIINKKIGIGRGISRDFSHSRFNGYGVNPQKIHANYREPYQYANQMSEDNYEDGIFQPCEGGRFESSRRIIEPIVQIDASGRRVSQGRGYYRLHRDEVNYKVQLHSKEKTVKLRNAVGPYVMDKISGYDNNKEIMPPVNYIREKCLCGALTNSVCSGCEKIFYCSRDCQVKDWSSHRSVCGNSSQIKRTIENCEKIKDKSDSSERMNEEVKPLRRPHESKEHSFNNFSSRNNFNNDNSRKSSSSQFSDKSDNQRPNKFQNNKFDDKGKQGFRSGKDNFYQRPPSVQKTDHDDKSSSKAGDDSSTAVSPNAHRSVADSIMNSVQSFKTEQVKPTDLSRSSDSFAASTPVSVKPAGSPVINATPVSSTPNLPSNSQTPVSRKPYFTCGVPVKVTKLIDVSEKDCYVVKHEDTLTLFNLHEDLNKTVTDSSPSVESLSVNLKCAAKYEGDWYRAKITSVDPLKVLFVDYGNEEVISNLSEVKVLPEKFRSILPLAARIYFKEDELHKTHWNLDDHKTIVAVSKEPDGRWFVTLSATNSDQSVSCNQQQPEIKTVENEVSPSGSGRVEESLPPSPVIDSTIESSSNVASVKEDYKPKELEPLPSLFENIEKTWKGSNIVEDITVGSCPILNVEEVIDDRVITASAYCKEIPYAKKLIEITVHLAKAPFDPDYRPKCGDVVGIHISNNEWSRAVIISVSNDNSYNVFLLDKGIKKDNIKEVKKLPGDSALYPSLAVTLRAHSDLKNNLPVGTLFRFELKSQDNGCWIGKIKKVKLNDNDDVESEEEIATGHLEAWEPEYTDDGRLKCLKLDSGEPVIISGGQDPQNMFVKSLIAEFIELYEALDQEVAAHCLNAEPLDKQPQLGDLVAAKWDSDRNFYRAQVLRKHKKDGYKVKFVDFGNVADVKFDDMRQLSATLKSKPCCAIRICLKDVPVKPFTASALEYINLLSDGTVPLIVEFEKLSSVKLIKRDDKSVVNDKLCELMIPRGVVAVTEGSDPSEGHIYRRNKLPLNKPLPIDETLDLVLLSVLPFSGKNIQFVMFSAESDVFKHVSGSLSEDISQYCSALPADDRYVPRTGELCIAKFADDGLHYRAECIKAMEYCAEVLFIDYGNVGEVPFQDIHKMPTDFMLSPAMALFCSAVDIPYREEVYKKLTEIVQFGEQISVKILKRKDDEYDVVIPSITEKLKKLGII